MGSNDWTRFRLIKPDGNKLLNPDPLVLDGESIDPGLLVQAAGSIRPVVLSEAAGKRISISRDIVDDIVASGQVAYAVTTGTMGHALHFAGVNCMA